MDWVTVDAELYEEGWRLQLNRLGAGDWKAFYGKEAEIPRTARAGSPVEAVEKAQRLIREGG